MCLIIILYLQEIDMVFTGLTISASRETVVDFSYPFFEERLGMMTRTVPEDPFYQFKPLSTLVWVCYVATALVIALMIRLQENLALAVGSINSKGYFSKISRSLWYFVGAVWFQGWWINNNG